MKNLLLMEMKYQVKKEEALTHLKKNQNPDLQSQNVVEATPSSNGSLDSLKRAGSEKKKTTMSAFITNNKNKELSSVKKTTNKMQATLSLFKKNPRTMKKLKKIKND